MARSLKRRPSTTTNDGAQRTKRSRLHFGSADSPPMTVTIRGLVFEPTPAFDTFWRFAAERQVIDERRRSGQSPPWTEDPILQNHKFCNTFRILDRGCQFLVTEVIEEGPQSLEEVTFRVLLFSLYTNPKTYETLRKTIHPFTWKEYKRANYEKVLRQLYNERSAIYTGAYQKPAPDLGFPEAFMNHLAFMEVLMQELPDRLNKAEYMADVFEWLRTFKSIGDFTAYQLLLNMSYSNVMNFSEYDFVVISIGSRRGLQRCFNGNIPRSVEVDLVRWMQLSQKDHFLRLGLMFNGLGDECRLMMLCDIEHTLCELDKYIRICDKPSKGHPFKGTGKLGQMRLPQAWYHEDRRILRIRSKVEAETEAEERFVVESIVDHRLVDGMQEFLVFWEGYREDEATWEPKASLMEDVPHIVKAYLKKVKVSVFWAAGGHK
ncbi:hypothetical protein V8B97DRAFT_1863210 [Scleroderma yunnanense]